MWITHYRAWITYCRAWIAHCMQSSILTLHSVVIHMQMRCITEHGLHTTEQYTVKPPNKDKFTCFVPCREVVLFLQVPQVPRTVLCTVERFIIQCPFLGGSNIGGSMDCILTLHGIIIHMQMSCILQSVDYTLQSVNCILQSSIY